MATTITKTSRYIPKTSLGSPSSVFISGNTNGVTTADLTPYYTGSQIDSSFYNKVQLDASFVHRSGNETITGIKTFNNNLLINADLGIGVSPSYSLHIQDNHNYTQFLMHSLGSGTPGTGDADLFMWASEPGVSYTGVGIANNRQNLTNFPRISTARGGSYMRLLDEQIWFSNISNADVSTFPLKLVGSNSIFGGDLGSDPASFVSGFAGSGWKLDDTGAKKNLEVDNLVVREGMKVYELEINKLSSINGGMVISAANATTLSVYSVAPSTWFFYIDEDGTNKPIQFVVDDYIRAQVWTGRGVNYFLGKVIGVSHSATFGNAYITVLGLSGTPWDIMDLVQVGHASSSSRQNLIYMTASDTNNPYIDVIAGVNNGVFTNKTKARLGNLTGLRYNDVSISGYGLWTDNAYLTGAVIANSGKIGGWVIDTSALIKDTGTAATSSGMAPLDYPFYAGSSYANRASAPFRVTPDGYLTSSLLINGYDSAGTDIIGKEDIPETYTNAVISSWTKIKELELGENIKGTVSIKVSFKVTFITGVNSYSARIYRNDNAVGTTRGPFNLDGTYTETIAGWTAGDLIQLYIYQPNFPGSGTTRFDNLRVLGTHSTALEEVTIVSGGDLMLQRNTLNNVKYETYSINASSYSVSAYAYSSFITTYSAGNCTITLPETSDLTIGQVFIFVNATTARTTVLQTPGVEQFYDAGGFRDSLNIGNRQSLTIMWNGTAWSVIAYR